MQTKDIPDDAILLYLADRQGSWTCMWGHTSSLEPNLSRAFPPEANYKLQLSKMRSMHRRGLVGGCTCGCRGDFEITDKGLAALNMKRTKKYSGYGEVK